jgi:hypothetical protein
VRKAGGGKVDSRHMGLGSAWSSVCMVNDVIDWCGGGSIVWLGDGTVRAVWVVEHAW